MMPDKVVLPGGGHAGSAALHADVRTAMLGNQSVASYSWEHGGSLPSPAEFMYTGKKIGVRIVRATPIDGFEYKDEHVVEPTDEKGEVTVLFIARAPSALSVGVAKYTEPNRSSDVGHA